MGGGFFVDSVVWCGYTHKTMVLRSTQIVNKYEAQSVVVVLLSSFLRESKSLYFALPPG